MKMGELIATPNLSLMSPSFEEPKKIRSAGGGFDALQAWLVLANKREGRK